MWTVIEWGPDGLKRHVNMSRGAAERMRDRLNGRGCPIVAIVRTRNAQR